MITLRKAADRGHADHGWLNTYHTFSFASYIDRNHMNFRTLRVMNEDRVQPGEGFGMHEHRDMEIISYVLEGALEHRDSLGNGSVLRPGEFQRMSAGSGVQHSEFNPSNDESAHFYQIWLLPEKKGIPPSYEQKLFPPAELQNRWRIVASNDGRDGSLTIGQDALVYLTTLDRDAHSTYNAPAGRYQWLQVLRGSVELNGQLLSTSDGAAITEETQLDIRALEPAELMLFDLV